MRAARIVAFREPLELAEVPDPAPGPRDAVIRVEAAGICRSDWHLWVGDWTWFGVELELPIIPGHELGGVVEAVGRDVQRVGVGDRVTVPFHESCGHCRECLAGRTNLCDAAQFIGTSHDGAYARYVRVIEADFNCVQLPEEVSFLAAAAIGCRYMTAYHAITRQGDVRAGQWVAVHGAGGVGLSALQIARAVGANAIAVDIDASKLKKAAEQGAAATVDARDGDVAEAIKQLTDGGAHVSIDALGVRETVLNSIGSLRKGGRHVQVGLTGKEDEGTVALPIDLMTQRELQFVGSLGNPHPDYAGLLSLVASGRLLPDSLVTSTIPLSDVNEVLGGMSDFRTVGFSVITEFA